MTGGKKDRIDEDLYRHETERNWLVDRLLLAHERPMHVYSVLVEGAEMPKGPDVRSGPGLARDAPVPLGAHRRRHQTP